MVAVAVTGSFNGVPPPIKLAAKRYFPDWMAPTGAANTFSANLLYYVPFWNDQRQAYAGMEFRDNGAGNNGMNVRVGIYAEAAAGGPGALTKDVGAVGLTGTAGVHTVANAFTLNANTRYYLALVSDNTPSLCAMDTSMQVSAVGWKYLDALAWKLGKFAPAYQTTGFTGSFPIGETATFTYGALNATAPTPTASLSGSGSGNTFPAMALYV